jgi:hypothetical protein
MGISHGVQNNNQLFECRCSDNDPLRRITRLIIPIHYSILKSNFVKVGSGQILGAAVWVDVGEGRRVSPPRWPNSGTSEERT